MRIELSGHCVFIFQDFVEIFTISLKFKYLSFHLHAFAMENRLERDILGRHTKKYFFAYVHEGYSRMDIIIGCMATTKA